MTLLAPEGLNATKRGTDLGSSCCGAPWTPLYPFQGPCQQFFVRRNNGRRASRLAASGVGCPAAFRNRLPVTVGGLVSSWTGPARPGGFLPKPRFPRAPSSGRRGLPFRCTRGPEGHGGCRCARSEEHTSELQSP